MRSSPYLAVAVPHPLDSATVKFSRASLLYSLKVVPPSRSPAPSDTQKKRDWYGSNPEGIDRDPTLEPCYSDELLPVVDGEDSDSDGEWSRATYSDASRSPSPSKPFRPPPSLKPKVIASLEDRKDQSRKGIKWSKSAPSITPKQTSTILKLPPRTPETRQAVFFVK